MLTTLTIPSHSLITLDPLLGPLAPSLAHYEISGIVPIWLLNVITITSK